MVIRRSRDVLPIAYEDRVLAFVDILGWKEAITRSEKDPAVLQGLGAALALLREAPRLWEHAQKNPDIALVPTATQFSDTLVLSEPSSDGAASRIAQRVRDYCWRMLLAGYLTRGAITLGRLYHDGSVVVGPALVEAHGLEQKVAIYPRIVLAPKIVEMLSSTYQTVQGDVYEDLHFRKDLDGVAHLHLVDFTLVRAFPDLAPALMKELVAAKQGVEAQMAPWEKNPQPRAQGILAKQRWLLGYLDVLGDLLKQETGRHARPSSLEPAGKILGVGR